MFVVTVKINNFVNVQILKHLFMYISFVLIVLFLLTFYSYLLLLLALALATYPTVLCVSISTVPSAPGSGIEL